MDTYLFVPNNIVDLLCIPLVSLHGAGLGVGHAEEEHGVVVLAPVEWYAVISSLFDERKICRQIYRFRGWYGLEV